MCLALNWKLFHTSESVKHETHSNHVRCKKWDPFLFLFFFFWMTKHGIHPMHKLLDKEHVRTYVNHVRNIYHLELANPLTKRTLLVIM